MPLFFNGLIRNVTFLRVHYTSFMMGIEHNSSELYQLQCRCDEFRPFELKDFVILLFGRAFISNVFRVHHMNADAE